jgi:hypothetical protein
MMSKTLENYYVKHIAYAFHTKEGTLEQLANYCRVIDYLSYGRNLHI